MCVLQGTLQQFVDNFFRSVLCSGSVVPPAVKYFFDFLDEQAQRHDNVDEETLHIWKTNRYEHSAVLCARVSSSVTCFTDKSVQGVHLKQSFIIFMVEIL